MQKLLLGFIIIPKGKTERTIQRIPGSVVKVDGCLWQARGVVPFDRTPTAGERVMASSPGRVLTSSERVQALRARSVSVRRP
ncbi:MAG: hypothetical protein HY344_04550 [Candidatus Levybacteria bacterium]|nr:hypothetical protein [Candidatus Levybacteria bacterium]